MLYTDHVESLQAYYFEVDSTESIWYKESSKKLVMSYLEGFLISQIKKIEGNILPK